MILGPQSRRRRRGHSLPSQPTPTTWLGSFPFGHPFEIKFTHSNPSSSLVLISLPSLITTYTHSQSIPTPRPYSRYLHVHSRSHRLTNDAAVLHLLPSPRKPLGLTSKHTHLVHQNSTLIIPTGLASSNTLLFVIHPPYANKQFNFCPQPLPPLVLLGPSRRRSIDIRLTRHLLR